MPWLMFALGLALASAGGLSVWHGYPYMQIEFGWTEVIAGAVAISGGVVTIGIGAVLLSLSALRAAVERSGIAAPRDLAAPRDVAPIRAEEPSTSPVPPPFEIERAATRSDEPTSAAPNSASEPVRSATPRSASLEGRPARPSRRSMAEPPLEEPPPAPTIVGRYESAGSSYVLFSDGTIEVESATGNHRFGSMDELKIHMGRENPEPPSAVQRS